MMQSKWFRFFVAMMKTVVVTVLAAAGFTLIGIYLAKYAGDHFPSGIVLGLTIGIAGGSFLTIVGGRSPPPFLVNLKCRSTGDRSIHH